MSGSASAALDISLASLFCCLLCGTLLRFASRLAELHFIVRLGRHTHQRAHNAFGFFIDLGRLACHGISIQASKEDGRKLGRPSSGAFYQNLESPRDRVEQHHHRPMRNGSTPWRHLTANLNFQTKMHIVRVMVNLLGSAKPITWKESADKTLNKIQSINDEWRTVVAHSIAISVNMTTIKFLKISAKRKLAFPNPHRTKKEFFQVDTDMLDCMNKLEQITLDLRGVSLTRSLASAPNQPWPSLADLSRPLPLAQGTPRSTSGTATGGIFGGMLATPPPKGGK
jgi:hypothetical protein